MQCFLLVNGQKHGPYELDQVREFLAQGQITPETQVWPEGATAWMPLRQLHGVTPGTLPAPEPIAAPQPIAAPLPLQSAGEEPDSTPEDSSSSTDPPADTETDDSDARLPQRLLRLATRWKIPLAVVTLTLIAWWWTTDFVIHVGASPGPGRPALILMHGHGAPADDLVPLAEQLSRLAPEVCFVVPPGPHGAGFSGRTWWPSVRAKSQEALAVKMEEVQRETREGVLDLVDELIDDGVAPGDIIVGGFSAGAMVALDVVLAEGAGRKLGGLVMLSGSLRSQKIQRLEGRGPLRAFISHGKSDGVVGIADSKKIVATLERDQHEVTWVEFAGAHQIPAEVIAALGKFLASY